MREYKAEFEVENGEGDLFCRQEVYHIVALGDYDVEETVLWEDKPYTIKRIEKVFAEGDAPGSEGVESISWRDELTTKKQIVVVSKEAFTIVINRRYWATDPDGEKTQELWQEVIQASRGPDPGRKKKEEEK